ncbi:MAG TPA: acyltransferase [Solirubrobacteraceae bacterium]|jgi:peptidoglycan/LPS O-acetylase OafA/YrhL|nr:acyltransferase [Solirubrobacteraceae bacterium]
MTTAAAPAKKRRITSYDGLRGIAAIGVVFNHVGFAAFGWYHPLGGRPPVDSWRWWVTYTPLHMIWAGPAIILFMLSGTVLSLAAASRGFGWFNWSYYPRRLVRLYLPAWAAIVIAGALSFGRPSSPIAGATPWLNTFAMHAQFGAGLKVATLLTFPAGIMGYIPLLWTMRWEVLFSALLPLALVPIILTKNRPRLAALMALLCFAIIGAQRGTNTWHHAPHFLALFALGAMLPFHAHRFPKIPRSKWPLSALVVVIAIVLLTNTYWSVNDEPIGDVGSMGLPGIGVALGGLLAVWVAHASDSVDRLLSARPAQWLGARAYSLYLIHMPIVVGVGFAFNGHPSVLVLAAISVPLSLMACDVFWRLIENPSFLLGIRIGEALFPSKTAAAQTQPAVIPIVTA